MPRPGRRPRLPAAPAVLAAWALAGIAAFALAYGLGWATAGTRSAARIATPLTVNAPAPKVAGLSPAAPLPPFRATPVSRKRPARRATPVRVVRASPPPPVRAVRRPPRPRPVVIVGKG